VVDECAIRAGLFLLKKKHVLGVHSHLAKRGVVLTYVLLQLYCEVLCLHRCILCASQTCPARVSGVSHAFQMHLNVTLELNCTVHKQV